MENKPILVLVDGTKIWDENGLLHRVDGPALEFPNGLVEWYYQGRYVNCKSQQEFEKLIKLKVFW